MPTQAKIGACAADCVALAITASMAGLTLCGKFPSVNVARENQYRYSALGP
jgi:hypothetical protein